MKLCFFSNATARFLLRAFFFGAITLVVSELICRIGVPEYRRDIYTYSIAGTVEHKADLSAKIYSDKSSDGWMLVNTDSKGLRFGETPKNIQKENSVNILLIGDSLSYGQHLNYDEVYAKLLEEDYANENKNVQFFNCSVIATNLIEQYHLFKNHCNFKNIDLIIIQPTVYDGPSSFALFYGEAMGRDLQIISFLHQCYSKINLRKYLTQDSFGILRLKKSTQHLREIYRNYFGAWTPFYSWSHLFRKLEHNFVLRHKFSCRELKSPLLYTSEAVNVFQSLEKKYNLNPIRFPTLKYAVQILKRWQSEAYRAGMNFLVLPLPNARGLNLDVTRISHPSRQFSTRIFKKRSRDQLDAHSEIYEQFLDALKREQILFIDFLPILSKYESDQLYIASDIHFNGFGHQVIAREIKKYLFERNLLK